jgi:hypothetical protein
VRLVLWPAATVKGVVIPLTLKPAPLTLTWEMDTLVFPLFVSVIACEALLPTTTSPKAKLPGFEFKVAFVATPLPASVRVCGDPVALSVKVTPPVTPPAEVGANCTLNEVLWPALSVNGVANPLRLKPEPEICARLMMRFALPPLVSWMLCELL